MGAEPKHRGATPVDDGEEDDEEEDDDDDDVGVVAVASSPACVCENAWRS